MPPSLGGVPFAVLDGFPDNMAIDSLPSFELCFVSLSFCPLLSWFWTAIYPFETRSLSHLQTSSNRGLVLISPTWSN